MIRVAGFQEESVVDGPGLRLTVFLRGCPHHCRGCHNPQTWSFSGGRDVTSSDIVERLKRSPMQRGITFSGGEPLMQADALLPVTAWIKSLGYSVWVYTGFLWEQVSTMPLLQYVDTLVDGPFILAEKSLELRFRGSKNQRVIDVQQSLKSGSVVLHNV